MKVSVSLTEEDVAFVDKYAAEVGVRSRSAVIHRAIDLLRSADLEKAYAVAWDEWDDSDDARLWDAAASDGIVDASR